MNYNAMAKKVHRANAKWWKDINTGKPIDRDRGELLMLVVTELAEAVEGIRKNLMDDKLPHRSMEEVEMADAVIRLFDYAGGFKLVLLRPHFRFAEGIFRLGENRATNIFSAVGAVWRAFVHRHTPSESAMISQAIWMIECYCSTFQLDLQGAIREKLAFNAKRKDHTHAHRRTANGKKF